MSFFLSIDQSLFQFINQSWTSSGADLFFPWITDLSKELWFQLIVYPLLCASFIYRYKKKGILIFLMCASCVGWADFFGNHFTKKQFERPRPFQVASLNTIQRSPAHGYSFVSNHATNMFAFAMFTSLVLPATAIPVFVLAFIVAYSRVYNGVHYPSDILGGALLGLLWGYFFVLLTRRFLIKAEKI